MFWLVFYLFFSIYFSCFSSQYLWADWFFGLSTKQRELEIVSHWTCTQHIGERGLVFHERRLNQLILPQLSGLGKILIYNLMLLPYSDSVPCSNVVYLIVVSVVVVWSLFDKKFYLLCIVWLGLVFSYFFTMFLLCTF